MVRLRWLAGAGIPATVVADRLASVTCLKAPLHAIVAFIFAYNLALEATRPPSQPAAALLRFTYRSKAPAPRPDGRAPAMDHGERSTLDRE
ncbi:MAG TPA: hypothetical protein VM658_00950 [bacterium]|nr:hypothetical protein [bacterium]